jgi:hypothetical protein
MFVFVATGLAVMGGAVYSTLSRTAARTRRDDRVTAVLLLISALLLSTALLIALAHVARA